MAGTDVADALILFVALLFRNGCAASAQDTELFGVAVMLLVALPKRGLVGFTGGVVV